MGLESGEGWGTESEMKYEGDRTRVCAVFQGYKQRRDRLHFPFTEVPLAVEQRQLVWGQRRAEGGGETSSRRGPDFHPQARGWDGHFGRAERQR